MLPGITFGFVGMGMGIVGTLFMDEEGVMCCGRTGALPFRVL